MKQTLRLGRIAGVPVGLHWSVLVIIALITFTLAEGVLPTATPGQSTAVYWSVAVPAAVLFFASLLAHELAHSVVARRRGVHVRGITLWMLGGVSELEDEAHSADSEFAIAVVGPLTSLGAGALFGLSALASATLEGPRIITQVLVWLAVTNVILAVFNMLPGAPLDGGRVLRAYLWRRHGDRARADRAAAQAGRAVGVTLIAAGALELLAWGAGSGLWLIVLGWFLMSAAGAEATSRIVHEAVHGLRVRDVMTAHPDYGAAWGTVEDFVSNVVQHSRQSVFPIADVDGAPVGVVTTRSLARVPADQRPVLRLSSVATPVRPDHIATSDTLVSELLDHAPLQEKLIAVVVDDRQITGMVTVDDLTHAVERRRLLHARPPSLPAVLSAPSAPTPADAEGRRAETGGTGKSLGPAGGERE